MPRFLQISKKDLFILLFIGVWFGVLVFVYLYMLPLLIVDHSLVSLTLSLFTATVVSLFFFFGPIFFLKVELDRLLSSGLTFGILLGMLYGLYACLLALLDYLSPNSRDAPTEFLLLVILGCALVYSPLRRLVQYSVDRLIFGSRPDYQNLLCEVSGRIATTLQLPDLVDILVNELPKGLQVTGIGLMIMEEKRSRLYPENLRFGSSLWSKSRLITLLRQGQQSFSCKRMVGDSVLSAELLEIKKAGFALVYGLQGGSLFAGMLLIGPRKDGTSYTSRDFQAFSILGSQVSTAIENALNFESLAGSNDQLQATFHKLVQAEKMAALGEMTAMLAHELINPLGIIRSSAQYLLSEQRSAEVQENLLQYVIEEVDSLNLIINNLLGLARHKPPKFRKVDLQFEIKDFVDKWVECEEHSEGVKINVNLPDTLPVLYADFKQLRQVLFNCVANSEEAMEAVGTITISIREIEQQRIEIVVEDTGPGVAEDDLKLVFKKFFTTKEKGVGLGLPVCRQVVRAHNGSIKLVNNQEGGARVIIRLPLRPLVTVGKN
ncbi:ATP-binding protein [Desulfogranum marinum]|uniref:sensor histidine kinase n=1 Tax=Desulfogranum marinum TaxID=453220 RepID=UPI0029C8C701|nr:ATP-binding protein [Desulfogranum marinum]